MKTASVVFGGLLCPVSASVVRAPPKSDHLREALAGFSSDGQRSTAMAKMFMGDLARKVAINNYKTTDVDMDTVESIKEFIGEIETHALAQHADDVALLQSSIDQVVACGLIPSETAANHTELLEECDTKGAVHDECRVEENTRATEMNDACLAYRNYRMHDVKPLSNDCMPNHMHATDISADRVSKATKLGNMEGCLVNSATWLFRLHELYIKCKQERDEHHETSEHCDVGQEEHEACVCGYRNHMVSACESAHGCYGLKSGEHAHKETDVKAREPTRKADHVAGEKIKCYFNVLTASSGEKQAILAGCEGLNPDTSQFNIQYPVVPALQSCPLPPSPCDTEWRNQHYLSHGWTAGATVEECTECVSSDPTHATLGLEWHPPTPVPTPEPTPDPTPEPTYVPARDPCECYDPEHAMWCNHAYEEDYRLAGEEGSRCHDSSSKTSKWCYFALSCTQRYGESTSISTEGKCRYYHGIAENDCHYDTTMATTPPPGGYQAV